MRFLPILIVLGFLAQVTAAEPPDLKELVAIAKRYDIPMPPKQAKLVLAHTGWSAVLSNPSTSREPGIYSPAFLLEKGKDGSVYVLRGAEREKLKERPGELIRVFDLEKAERKPGGYIPEFDRASCYICAVQLAERGELETAKALWKKSSAAGAIGDIRHHEDQSPYINDPPKLLARCIYEHLRNETVREPKRWPQIQASMTKLFDEFPFLVKPEQRERSFSFANQRREFLADLTATVKAPPAKDNSVEALLLEWSRRPGTMRRLGVVRSDQDESEAVAPANKILGQGLSAVPELIALLDDKRMTVHDVPQIMNSIPRVKRLGELAETLLEELSGDRRDQFTNKAQPTQFWKDWWAKNGKQPEKETMLKKVFTYSGDKITRVNKLPAMILADRFPEELPSLAKKYLESARSSLQPSTLAEAIAGARLPKEERVKLLIEFLSKDSIEHNRCVLQVLAELDAKKCAELVGPIIDELPTRPSQALWICPEAHYTHVVMRLEDDAVWKKYLEHTRKCETALRMEIMNPFNYSYIKDKNRQRRLAFLAAFLDDDALRQTNQTGPYAAFKIPKMTVRDFVAMQVASILDLKDRPDEFWSAEQWTQLRETVKKALKSEKLPDLAK